MKNKSLYIIGTVITVIVLCSWLLHSSKYESTTPNEQQNDLFIKITDACSKTGITFSDNSAFTIQNILPSSKNNYKIYDHKYFVLGYADMHRQPAWVCWLLTRKKVITKVTKRKDNFREDSSLACCNSTLDDYRRSGYARGHICPSADMLWDEKANSETFLLSNISPQVREFNDGKWNELENASRTWAVKNDSVIIISGAVFKNSKRTVGNNKVTVPEAFYKIIVDISYPKCKTIAFIMPNRNIKESIFNYATTIKEVEKQTDLNFFPQYDNNPLIQKLETMCDTNMWK